MLQTYKLVFVLFLLLLGAVNSYAQNKKDQFKIDSLSKALSHEKSDAQRITILNALCGYTTNTRPDLAIMYADSGLHVARKAKLPRYTMLFYEVKGELFMNKGKFGDALKQFDSCYHVAALFKEKKLMAMADNGYGAIYEMQGNFAQAQNYFFKCLELAEQTGNTKLMGVSYVNISVTFAGEKNFPKSILYSNKTVEIAKKTPIPYPLAKAYEILGTAYNSFHQTEKAKQSYYKALKIYQDVKNNAGVATMYSLLGPLYVDDQATQLQLYFNAKTIFDKIAPDNLYAVVNVGNIGIAYAQQARLARHGSNKQNAASLNLLTKAESYLMQGVSLAKTADMRDAIIDMSDSLASVDAILANYKEAYFTLSNRNKIYDSIFSQENKNKIASLEGKHEIELRDKKLTINQLEIANQHKQQWFLIAGLLALLCVAGLIYFQNIQRKKSNIILSRLNNELDEANRIKTRFFSILNHDLRAPVANFVSFLHLQQNAPDLLDEASKAGYAKKATASAEGLLETMEDLLLWSKGQMENFKPVIKSIPVSYLFDEVQKSLPQNSIVTVNFTGQTGMELLTDEHYVKTIMHNLTNNAIKALIGVPDSLIEWKAWDQNGTKFLSITDNGPGATEEQLKPLYDDTATIGIKSGLGLHIVRDMARAIGCEIIVDLKAEKGVEIKLKFS